MERNWKGKLCWSILQLKYGCLHILTVHNIKEKMEEAFVKFVLFVQDDNGKGNFIRKQRKRGGGWYSISLFQYRDLGASTIVEFRGKMHL